MSDPASLDSFGTLSELKLSSGKVFFYRLKALPENGMPDVSRLPFSIKILIEQVLRSEDGRKVRRQDIENLARYAPRSTEKVEIPFMPARVLMQDFTGVPAVVELAAQRRNSYLSRFRENSSSALVR